MTTTQNDPQVSLQQQLSEFKVQFYQQIPAEAAQILQSNIDEQVRSGIADRALKTGSIAPDFTLPDADGKLVSLSSLLSQGPIVLVFYRGEWCPYCNLQLRAYQQVLPKIQAYGATLVAVSLQTPEKSQLTSEKLTLTFPVLTDKGGKIAHQYGLTFTLSNELHALFEKLGINLPDYNGDQSWQLPIPGTFIIDTQGVIRLAFVDADFTHRLEPTTILHTLQTL